MNGPKFIERNIGPNISLRDVTSALCESVYSQGSFGGFYQHVLELSKTLDIFIDSILNFVQPKFEMQEKISDDIF